MAGHKIELCQLGLEFDTPKSRFLMCKMNKIEQNGRKSPAEIIHKFL